MINITPHAHHAFHTDVSEAACPRATAASTACQLTCRAARHNSSPPFTSICTHHTAQHQMFFVSLHRPTRAEEQAVCERGRRLGFNFGSAGSSASAPPLPDAAREDGWWNVDHERVKVGYGRATYSFARDLLLSWGHFQLPWAQVAPSTPVKPGSSVCVAANVCGLWTAVPLQIVYKQEGKWKQPKQQQPKQQLKQQPKQQEPACPRKQRHGRQMSYAHACHHTHFLAGEERFRVEWDQTDDSVWYDIYTYSRPAHPLAYLGYPVVRFLQQRFRADSLRSVARAAACRTVDASLDDATRRRLALMEDAAPLRRR